MESQKELELKSQLLEQEKQIVKSESKALAYKEKLKEIQDFPEIARKNAILDYDLKLARQFVASKAFPNMTPEQAYVLIKAGEELELSPMQSMSMLYIVNGNVGFWGAGLVAQLTKNGVILSYENETQNGVTVNATYKGITYTEVVRDTDQILQKSKAMSFAKKNKMRYHGVKMIASFYLPHLTKGISVWEADDIEAAKQLTKGDTYHNIAELIESAEIVEQLDMIMESNRKELTHPKNIELLASFGRKKKELES